MLLLRWCQRFAESVGQRSPEVAHFETRWPRCWSRYEKASIKKHFFRLRHQNQAFLLPPRHPFCLKDLEIHLEALLHGITHLFQLAGIPRMLLSDASNMGQLGSMQHQKLVRATNSTNKTSESVTVSCSN